MTRLRLTVLFTWCLLPSADNVEAADHWADRLLDVPYAPVDKTSPPQGPILHLVQQDVEELEINQSVIRTPLTIGNRRFDRGLGTHSNGHIRITSPEPIVRFTARIGVDNNERTEATRGSVIFSVSTAGQERFCSDIVRSSQEPQRVDIEFDGARDGSQWLASQFHRPDLDRGLILVIPPLDATERSVELALHALDPKATYELHYQITDEKMTAKGAELMNGLRAIVPEGDGGEWILHCKLP